MGQLGDGTTSDRSRPVLVDGSLGVGVKAFAAGHQHSLGLTLDGALWSWGDNRYGQLGLGVADRDSHPLPTKVAGVSAGAMVAAGHRFSLAMREDGTLWAFGDNDSGQLGDGTYADRASPAPIVTADEQELARAPSSGGAGTPFKIYNAKGGQGLVDDELCDRLATVGVKAVDDSYDINVFMGLDGFEESEACGIFYDDEAVYAVWVAANRADGSWYFRGDGGWQLYTDSAFEAPLPAYRDQVDRGQIAGVAIPLIMGRDRYTSDWDGAVFYVGYGTSEADMMQAGRFRPVVTADLDAAPK
jgi:hypothetical protein